MLSVLLIFAFIASLLPAASYAANPVISDLNISVSTTGRIDVYGGVGLSYKGMNLIVRVLTSKNELIYINQTLVGNDGNISFSFMPSIKTMGDMYRLEFAGAITQAQNFMYIIPNGTKGDTTESNGEGINWSNFHSNYYYQQDTSVVNNSPPPYNMIYGNNIAAIAANQTTITTKTNPDGTTSTETTIDKSIIEDKVKSLNDSYIKEITVALGGTTPEKALVIKADAVQVMADNYVELTLKAENIALSIPSDMININALTKKLTASTKDVSLRVSIKELTSKEADSVLSKSKGTTIPVTKVYEFNLEAVAANGKILKIEDFGNRTVRGEIPLANQELKKVKNSVFCLNVYRYNETSKEWENRRTQVKGNKAYFVTNTFSKYTVMENSIKFDDISHISYNNKIKILAAKHIIDGVGNNKFNPDGKMTRAEFVALLVRALGLKGEVENPFFDVKNEKWYAREVALAYHYNIVAGIGNGNFAPENLITRQEMVTTLVRIYERDKYISNPGSINYSDQKDISTWAYDYVAKASSVGIIDPTGQLRPQQYAARAEGAEMLYNLLKIQDKL